MAGMTADEVYVLLGDEITLLTEEVKQMEGWEPIEHKGTVQTAEDLPADAKKGWMYNIATDSVYGAAGMNVVMTSKGWDPMGPIINMNLYLTKEEGTKSFQPKGNYLSGTDTDLKESGKAADAKATGEKIAKNSSDIAKKLGKNQGSENSGKVAGINEVGDIVPMFPMGVEYNSETNCLEFGSDQKMKLNQGIGLDNTLTKSGSAADAGVTGKKIDSLKEDLANLENTLELPKDIYVLEPSDIQSGYIIDSNGTIRTNENCTLYKYDVTNINSVYISHRGAASMPVYWLEKNVLISHFTAEYDIWSGKVDTSNADTLYLNMISIYTPVVSCLVEGKRVPGYGKSYVNLQGKSSGHFYLINSESGCFSQQETTDSQYATYYPIFLKAGKYRFNSAVSTTFSIIVKNDEISHLNFTENKLNIVEFDTDVTLYPTSTRGRDAVICDASIDILSVSDKGLFPICNPIYVGNKMDFSTIKEATTYISDSSKEKEYNIYIEKGTYNESSITLPDYVNLIGLSNEKESVWVKGELPDNALDTEITPNSTINISMNNKFKNITVSAKNLRYSVHDESNNKQKNWNQRFDNCKFIHYGTYGAKSYREEHGLDTSNLWTSCHAWGEGASDGSFIEFNDCIFESVENGYYVHEGISQSEPYKRIFNNCEFIMIDTVNINQKWNNSISIDNTRDITAKNILLFNNCFISDSMRINGTIPIDVRLSGCGIVPIRANMNTDMYPLNTECMDDCYYVGDTLLVGGEVLAITNRHNQVVIANENTQKELICGVAVGTVNEYGYVRVMKKGYISLAGKNGILYTVGENGQIANATNDSKLIIGVCVGQFVKLLID